MAIMFIVQPDGTEKKVTNHVLESGGLHQVRVHGVSVCEVICILVITEETSSVHITPPKKGYQVHIDSIIVDPNDDTHLATPLMSNHPNNREREFPEYGITIKIV